MRIFAPPWPNRLMPFAPVKDRDTPGQERYEPAGGFSQEDLEAFFAQQFGQFGQRSDWGATGRARAGRGGRGS